MQEFWQLLKKKTLYCAVVHATESCLIMPPIFLVQWSLLLMPVSMFAIKMGEKLFTIKN
jgi:hypothetical protein